MSIEGYSDAFVVFSTEPPKGNRSANVNSDQDKIDIKMLFRRDQILTLLIVVNDRFRLFSYMYRCFFISTGRHDLGIHI